MDYKKVVEYHIILLVLFLSLLLVEIVACER